MVRPKHGDTPFLALSADRLKETPDEGLLGSLGRGASLGPQEWDRGVEDPPSLGFPQEAPQSSSVLVTRDSLV